MALTLLALIDDQKCFQTVRELRWPEGVKCPHCGSAQVAKRGFDETQKERQRYRCGGCEREFDDLTGTIFAGHRQPLRRDQADARRGICCLSPCARDMYSGFLA